MFFAQSLSEVTCISSRCHIQLKLTAVSCDKVKFNCMSLADMTFGIYYLM